MLTKGRGCSITIEYIALDGEVLVWVPERFSCNLPNNLFTSRSLIEVKHDFENA